VRANAARILTHLPKGTRLMAVVKANGYGHGAVPVARAALGGGATWLAVATLEEARELTGLAHAERILVMGGLVPEQAAAAAASGFSIGVSSAGFARALGDSDEVVPVHMKIDTGMGRFGAAPDEAPALARLIDESAGLRLAGTWTHFASAGTDEVMTRAQFDQFVEVLGSLGLDPGLRHASNSAAALRYPEMALDAVRAGIALYGCEWPGTEPALAPQDGVGRGHRRLRGHVGSVCPNPSRDGGHRLRRRRVPGPRQWRPRARARAARAAHRGGEHGCDHR